jgi:gluconolactonase
VGLVGLVSEASEPIEIASGYVFTEGPVWVPSGQYLLFSDVGGSTRHRWSEEDGAQQVAGPTGHGNGMTLDADGRLLVCVHDTSVVARMGPDGTGSGLEIVASHWNGREINGPNDIVVSSSGSIYFTDPPWARLPAVGVERERDLDFCGVFRVDRDGSVELVADDFETPNGLCFSPDEGTLYVNDTHRGHIREFEVHRDGGLGSGRVFADGIGPEPGGAVDGMKCDEHGNVWVTGPGGLWVFTPDGTHLGVLPMPARVGNFHWGGPDWSWLFVCASAGVYRVPMKVSGRREPFMSR